MSDRIQAYALYIDPPLGRCGLTDAEVRKSGRAALLAKYPMNRPSRAFEKGETQGFIKICVDAETKQILGAAILGTGGDEVIHVLLACPNWSPSREKQGAWKERRTSSGGRSGGLEHCATGLCANPKVSVGTFV